MPNNLTEQDIQDLNHWLSHFNDIYREMADNDVPVSMSGGEPLTSWETVDKIWFSPKQEYIGQIIDFPDAVSKLQTLEFIRIENIVIPEFPECLTKVKKLKTVIFNNTQMNSVGPSIGNLSNLIKLDLNDNNLVEIPDEICGLISLEEFGVSNNNLESLPDAFSDMKNLARFFAYGNQISTIPESIEFNIQNLISCEFQDNPIRNMSESLNSFLGSSLKWRMPAGDIGKRQQMLQGR
jgi:Leucine-rich repeat (LRR) protein